MARLLFAAVASSVWLGLILLAIVAIGEQPTIGEAAQEQMAVGIDAAPLGNSATSLGSIDPCMSVTSGQTFDVDLFIRGVRDFSGWQAMLIYDGSIVNVVSRETGLLLAANDGSNLVDLSPDPLPDADGVFTLAVADLGESPGEDGPGILARLTLQAVGPGATALDLTDTLLADSAGEPIGDTNGDQLFDGPISGAQIWVDQPCPSEPLPTLTPPAPVTTRPPATPLTPGASPTAAETLTPGPPTAGQPVPGALPTDGEEDDGFPWPIASGAAVGAALVAVLLGLASWRLLRRTG